MKEVKTIAKAANFTAADFGKMSEIKDYVLAKTGLKVSTLYIAQVKQKHGIIEQECYHAPKTDGCRVPQCPPEKEKAIEDALRHFEMV